MNHLGQTAEPVGQLALPDLETGTQSGRVALLRELAKYDYHDVREVGGKLCGLRAYVYTVAIEVDIVDVGTYQRRYCYEHALDARRALAVWDGRDHPGGPWIKCKGIGIDLLNPEFCQAP